MTEVMEKLLSVAKLDVLYEEKKDKIADALWGFSVDFYSVCETDPLACDMRNHIKIMVKYLPEVVKFKSLYDAPLQTKEEVLDYLVEKLYVYSIQKMETEDRGTLQNP